MAGSATNDRISKWKPLWESKCHLEKKWLQAVAVTKLHMVNIKLESNGYRYIHGIPGPFLSFCVHVFPAFLNICIGLLCGQYTFWKPANAATRPRVELLSKR
jgi:hypothetical protein